MSRQRRKNDTGSGSLLSDSERFVEDDMPDVTLQASTGSSLRDYFKFAIYCLLLAVPLYAITESILKRDWVMALIDALIVPVGFVHGLFLLFGYMG